MRVRGLLTVMALSALGGCASTPSSHDATGAATTPVVSTSPSAAATAACDLARQLATQTLTSADLSHARDLATAAQQAGTPPLALLGKGLSSQVTLAADAGNDSDAADLLKGVGQAVAAIDKICRDPSTPVIIGSLGTTQP